MKKLAAFIVEKRIAVLIGVLVVTAVCAVLATMVSVNTDMTEYLPDDSSMKMGLDRMEEEFPDAEESFTIRVMFTGLGDGEKAAIAQELAAIPNVDKVSFQPGDPDYNSGDYSLYILSTSFDFDTEEELAVEEALTGQFARNGMVFVRDETTTPGISTTLLILALSIMMLILFAMCASWAEPVLFLIAIGVAVVINMGTNFFLGTISEITSSIAAILQLVLSMDYSIILINRYRQELELTDNKYDAMKNALANAFSSIASSAVTTVVGLVMLVFMRFKIGFDLGIVLAKGVAISMLCIFTLLPVLILLWDNLIRKTSKKVLHIKMDTISAFSYRFRHVIAGLLVALFAGSYFLQQNTEIAYTLEEPDPIADVFPATNTILVLFDNQDDARVTEIAQHLEGSEHIKSVASLSTTIDRPYTARELSDELEELTEDSDFGMDLDASMLDILYYYYYRNGETGSVTTGDFLRFLADDVANNEAFEDQLDDDIRDNLDLLSTFADPAQLKAPKTGGEIAALFDMDGGDIADLLVYYYSEYGGVDAGTMTLPQFVAFIQDDVMADEAFGDLFDDEILDRIDTLSTLTSREGILTPKGAREIADTLDMEPDDLELLFLYYFARHGGADDLELTFPQFAGLLLDEVLEDERFAGRLDEGIRADAGKLAVFADPARFRKPETGAALADTLGMDSDMAELLYLYYFADHGAVDNNTLTIPRFSSLLVNDILKDDRFADSFDAETREQIEILGAFGNERKFKAEYTSRQFAGLMGIKPELADFLFAFYYAENGDLSPDSMTVSEFVRFLREDIAGSRSFSSLFGKEEKAQIEQLAAFTDSATLLKAYTSGEMTRLLGGMGLDKATVDLVYAMALSQGAEAMTLPDFLDLLLTRVLAPGSPLAGMVDEATASQVKGIRQLIQAAQGGPCSAGQLAALTGLSLPVVRELLAAGSGMQPQEPAGRIPLGASGASFEAYDGSDSASPGDGTGGDSEAGGMSLTDFLGLALGLSADPYYAGLIGEAGIAQLTATYGILQLSLSGQSFSAQELAGYLGLDPAQVAMLFRLAGDATGTTLTLSAFLDFLADNFGPMLGEAAEGLAAVKGLKDAALSGAALSDTEMVALTGMDSSLIAPLYIYHMSRNSGFRGDGVVLYDLVEYVSQDLANSGFGGAEMSQISQMSMLLDLMDGALEGTRYTPGQLGDLIGMEPDMLTVMYAYQVSKYGDTSGWRISLQTLVDYVLDDMATGEFGESLQEEDLDSLEMARTLMESTSSGRRFTARSLADLVDMEPDMLRVLYAYYLDSHGDTSGWRLSLQALVDYILTDLAGDEDFADTFDEGALEDLGMLRDVMAGSLAGTAYGAEALASLVDMDPAMPRQLYLLNISRYGDTSGWLLSLEGFIRFIHDDVLTDPDLAGRIDRDSANLLDGALEIVDSVLEGDALSAEEMGTLLDGLSGELTGERLKLLYVYFFSRLQADPAWTFSLLDLFNYLVDDILPDPLFADVLDGELRETLLDTKADLDEGILQLRGPSLSRMIISTTFPGESDETYAFLGNLIGAFDSSLEGQYYLVGNSAMNYEMSQSFGGEMTFITILTAISIFIVVLVTFRNLLIPSILVLIIQCGVYITVSIIGFQGYSIYYLALLIVQCILMGATIDYGILFTNYYVENRRTHGVKEALTAAYNVSIHTILTSGLIMIIITGILGKLFENPTVGQICETISKGALCATLLIVFVLPGVLAVFDRWIIGRNGKQDKETQEASKT